MSKKAAYGGVLVREDRKILLRQPTRHYGGYVWTFPKGRQEPDATSEQTALREVLEETGYRAHIVSKIPGTFEGDVTRTEFYLMRPVGDPIPFDRETAEVRWVSLDDAAALIAKTTTSTGRDRDLAVLAAVRAMLTPSAN